MALIGKVLRFGSVGVVGFIVDAGLLLVFVKAFGLAPLPARIYSFLVAATVTFLLNQRFTFQLQERFSVHRWSYYIVATGIGALINVGVYHWWLTQFGVAAPQLTLGTAVGSLVAMCVNFFVSQRFVFANRSSTLPPIPSDLSERTP